MPEHKYPDYLALSVPFLFLLVLIELAVARARRLPYYRLADTVNSMNVGLVGSMVGIIAGLWLLGNAYVWVYERARLVEWSPSQEIWMWVMAFVGVDFLYYWWHRLSHEVNFLWAAHLVHHQSEEYNLSTAFRQNWLTSVSSAAFYLPLAVLGVPLGVFVTCRAFNLLYQFWIHTRLIGKLGPVEAVMNTPSHHRVHHGMNPEYLDRNYAGVFIVWDRWFGSFEEERAPVSYGVLKPLRTWDPLLAVWQGWESMLALSGEAGAKGLARWKVLFARPDWSPGNPRPSHAELRGLFEGVADAPYSVEISRSAWIYLLVQFVVLMALLLVFPTITKNWSTAMKTVGALWFILSCMTLGWVSSNRPRLAIGGELARHALLGAAFWV